MRKKGFTLLEFCAVVIIIGILSTISIAYFTPYRENILDREAQSNLRLIRAAQRTRFMETGAYAVCNAGWPTDQESCINANLSLSLPGNAAPNKSWDYRTWGNGCSESRRTSNPPRDWKINISQEEPTAGLCP